jgi:uncharacterized protein (TIGR02246 family)
MTDLATRSAPGRGETTTSTPPSRRRWVSFVIVALLVLGAGAAGWALGSTAGDDDTAPVEVPDTIQRWADAWMARDADAFAEQYEEDGFFDGVLGWALAGRAEIREGIGEYWPVGPTDVTLTADYVFDDGTIAVVVWNYEETAPDGEAYSDRRVTNFEWAWDDPDLLRHTSQNW